MKKINKMKIIQNSFRSLFMENKPSGLHKITISFPYLLTPVRWPPVALTHFWFCSRTTNNIMHAFTDRVLVWGGFFVCNVFAKFIDCVCFVHLKTCRWITLKPVCSSTLGRGASQTTGTSSHKCTSCRLSCATCRTKSIQWKRRRVRRPLFSSNQRPLYVHATICSRWIYNYFAAYMYTRALKCSTILYDECK